MKLSIIIPSYNEARYIDEVIKRIKGVTLPKDVTKEIIIIDDGSTDSTQEILKKHRAHPEIKIHTNHRNFGKSAAVKTGIEKAQGDILLIQDADLEYSPDNYPALIAPIIDNKTSVVYASRFKGEIKGMKLINRIANRVSNMTFAFLYGARITDVNTCHKAFKKEVFDKIAITSRNFEFETEVTAKLLNLKYLIYEVPIVYSARSKKEGKKITWYKALQMYLAIIKYKFNMDGA